jgi:hypothetical protein
MARFSGRSTAPPPVASTILAALRQFIQDARLALAEAFLALELEDRGDPHAAAGFDLVVGVEERAAELVRHGTTDRRLAGAHEADEEEIVSGGLLIQDRALDTGTSER